MKNLVFLVFVLVAIPGCTQLISTQKVTTLDWCIAGEKWLIDGKEAGTDTGITTFEGQARCQVTHVMDVTDGEMTTNFYILDQENKDIWIEMIHPTIGTKTGHTINKQCTEGDCEYFQVASITSS